MKMKTTACLALILMSLTNLRAAEPVPGKQVAQELKADAGTVPYLFYLPKNYKADGQKWPVMLFLHGRGESRGPLSVVAKWGPPRIVERGEDLPYILISPHFPPLPSRELDTAAE